MSEKQKTAMRKLIDYLNLEIISARKERDACQAKGDYIEASMHSKHALTCQEIKSKATELKETTEKSQIVEARKTAPTLSFSDERSYDEEAEDYYTTKFSK